MNFDNPEAAALEGIRALENFYRRMGMPTNLRELGLGSLSDAQIREMADKCTGGGTFTVGSFVPLGREDVETIFKMAR